MAYAKDSYTSAGEATFTITFPYLSSDHIELYVNDVSSTFTLDSATVLRPDSTPASGASVVIQRNSSRGARIIDYTDASVLRADTLDQDFLQCFYVSQEAFDATTSALDLNEAGTKWDALNLPIINLTDGTGAQDAATVGQVTALVSPYVTYATEWANKAEDSLVSAAAGGDLVDDYSALHHANKASASATAAASSASSASTSASNASTSASNASTSASNASTSETNAATSASNASTSATNAATSETNAAASEAALDGMLMDLVNNTAATRTLGLTDANKFIQMNNASAMTLTVPPNSSVAFSLGTVIHFIQRGAGTLTIAAGSGVTLNSSTTLVCAARYSVGGMVKVGTDLWFVWGDLAP